MTDPDQIPPVFFNHLYIVLDDKTYRAIQASEFLRNAFPGMEQRATLTAAGETWYGTYYYCRDNYLEFFGESTGKHWQAGAQEGWAGLAFSTDQSGGAARVRLALRNTFHYEPFTELRKVQLPQKTIEWFQQVKLAERLELGSFDSWVMEYHPDIFVHKGIPIPDDGNLTRQAYLSPWNRRWEEAVRIKTGKQPAQAESGAPARPPEASQKKPGPAGDGAAEHPAKDSTNDRPDTPLFPRTPVFSRVIGATIHMDGRLAERYAEILMLLGYSRADSGPHLALSAHGFTLLIQPLETAPPGYSLSSLRLQMARPSVAPMTFVFAPGSRLILNQDLVAEWQFGHSPGNSG